MMSELDRRPVALLLVASATLLLLLNLTGQLTPVFCPDSEGYVDFDWSAPLSQTRTIGYPSFLAAMSIFGQHQAAVPIGHWLALTISSVVFYRGMSAIGYRRWVAGWCAVAVLFGRGVWDLGHLVIADSLALSMAICATGCFLSAIAAGARSYSFVVCMLLTFVAYQIRPAFLFLLPLWPIATLLPHMWVGAFPGWSSRLRTMMAFAAGVALPFVAFCTMRAGLVGHWGLVSFGGANIVGIAGQFLDEDVVIDLSADVRPLAISILESRKRIDTYQPPSNFAAMQAMFDTTVWKMAVPAAAETSHGDKVKMNEALTSLSHQVLKLRPQSYVQWLLWNLNHARQQIIQLTAFDKGTVLAGLLFFCAHLWSLVKPWHFRGDDGTRTVSVEQRERHILLWLALLFAAGKTALVVLVEPANDRYMTPAMVLLPTVIMLFSAQYAFSIMGAGDVKH